MAQISAMTKAQAVRLNDGNKVFPALCPIFIIMISRHRVYGKPFGFKMACLVYLHIVGILNDCGIRVVHMPMRTDDNIHFIQLGLLIPRILALIRVYQQPMPLFIGQTKARMCQPFQCHVFTPFPF